MYLAERSCVVRTHQLTLSHAPIGGLTELVLCVQTQARQVQAAETMLRAGNVDL
jgi:hypothetical protein